MVKMAVLKAYEMVSEVYRQKFRHREKGDKQTNVEVVCDLSSHFHRWCQADKLMILKVFVS